MTSTARWLGGFGREIDPYVRKRLNGGACSWCDNTGVSEARHTGPRDSSLLWLVVAAYAVTASRERQAKHFTEMALEFQLQLVASCKIWNNYPILYWACIKLDLGFISFCFECEELEIFLFFSLGIMLFVNDFQGKISLLQFKELISLNQKNLVWDLQRNWEALTLLWCFWNLRLM